MANRLHWTERLPLALFGGFLAGLFTLALGRTLWMGYAVEVAVGAAAIVGAVLFTRAQA